MAFNIDKSTSVDSKNSRLVQGGDTDVYRNRLGWWERRTFEKRDTDYIINILPNEVSRPDLISYRVYGKAIYSWLVLQYNNIVDPETELSIGVELRLPSQPRLMLDIITKPTGGKQL